MVDDVLRLRATVVNEEALANIRMIGRELGMLGPRAGAGVRQVNRELDTLGSKLRTLGSELRAVVPAFGGIGLGAAGVGIAMGAMLRTFADAAKRVTELKYASRELGMSERDIRAWGLAAEKVGISSESMTQGLQKFSETMNGLKYNVGGVRSELYQMGAGPVVQRMQAAATQADKMKVAFDFKEALNKDDPTGFKARRFFDMIGLGADKARLTYEQFAAAQAKVKVFTPEEQAAAEKFNATLAEMSEAWNTLLTKQGIKIFPQITREIQDIEKFLGLLGQVDEWIERLMGKPAEDGDLMGQIVSKFNRLFGLDKWDPFGWKGQSAGGGAPTTPPGASVPSVPGRARGGPVSGGHGFIVGERGPEFLVPGGGGSILQNFGSQQSGMGLEEFTRAVKSGTFDALVEWTSWLRSTGGEAGAGGGGGIGAGGSGPLDALTGKRGGGGAGRPATFDERFGKWPGGGSAGGGGGPAGTSTGGGSPGSAAQLNDETGRPIDPATMKQAEALGRAGDIPGLQKLFAEKGYRMSGPACGMVAGAYVKSAGFKPPPGGAIATNWRNWGQAATAADANKPGVPFGSIIATSKTATYGSKKGQALGTGETGGHVGNLVPGTYDPKTNTAMFADQYGVSRRSMNNMDVRYAGDEAVAAAAAKRGEAPAGAQVAAGAAPAGATTPKPGESIPPGREAPAAGSPGYGGGAQVQGAPAGTQVAGSSGGGGAAWDSMVKGTPLEGQWDKVVAAAKANGVPPQVMGAVIAHESGRGKNVSGNNVAGLMDPKTGSKTKMEFGSIDEGIARAGRTIGNRYREAGGDLDRMGAAYAPVGAANDPRGLNKFWAGGVRKFRDQLGGGGEATAAGQGADPRSAMAQASSGGMGGGGGALARMGLPPGIKMPPGIAGMGGGMGGMGGLNFGGGPLGIIGGILSMLFGGMGGGGMGGIFGGPPQGGAQPPQAPTTEKPPTIPIPRRRPVTPPRKPPTVPLPRAKPPGASVPLPPMVVDGGDEAPATFDDRFGDWPAKKKEDRLAPSFDERFGDWPAKKGDRLSPTFQDRFWPTDDEKNPGYEAEKERLRGYGRGIRLDELSTNRLDGAVSPPPVNATGTVNVDIVSNGTAAKAEANTKGMFQDSRITQHKQMPDTAQIGAA